MILISARWVLSASVAKLKMSASCPAPAVLNKSFTIIKRPIVVLNHADKKSRSNSSAFGVVQRFHLFGGEHAGHQRHRLAGFIHLRHALHGHGIGFAARREPAAHKGDFVGLRAADARAQQTQLLIFSVRGDPRGHHDRLRMMHDHPLHEGDVGGRWRRQDALGRGRKFFRWLAGRTGLHDGRSRGLSRQLGPRPALASRRRNRIAARARRWGSEPRERKRAPRKG